MKYKVELGFIDSIDESKDVFWSTYIEAESCEEAVEIAKKVQTKERPDLNPIDRWFWIAFETNEEA